MKAYKIFNNDWTCRGFQYEVGKTYRTTKKIGICNWGFHSCLKLSNCLKYYNLSNTCKIAEVSALGEIIKDPFKLVSSKIKIVKEISLKEAYAMVNIGVSNTGKLNSGDNNLGNCNTGNFNDGIFNSGNNNTGNCNAGCSNKGNDNTGNCNTGSKNTGNFNIGSKNTGIYNSGIQNTGKHNVGNSNVGFGNYGNNNVGNFNTSNYNIGNFNKKSFNTGSFNLYKHNNFCVFDKECDAEIFNKAYNKTYLFSSYFSIFTETGNKRPFKTACRLAFLKYPRSNTIAFTKLPNFNADIFKEITGINIQKYITKYNIK